MGMTHIWNVFSLSSAEKADLVIAVFHGFSKSFQAISTTATTNGPQVLPPHFYLIHYS